MPATFTILYDPAAESNFPTPDNVMRCRVRMQFPNPYVVNGLEVAASDCSAAGVTIVDIQPDGVSLDATVMPIWDAANEKMKAFTTAAVPFVEYGAVDLDTDPAKSIVFTALVKTVA
jgi:hypothetical protein